MYLAIKGNHKDVVKYMITHKTPIYNKDPAHVDNSPIFFVLKARNHDIMELFCDLGIHKFNFLTNSKGHNPLTYAASINNWDAVNYLSGRGMYTDVEDQEGLTVFFRALNASQFDIASKLLSRGTKIDAFNRNGQTALSYFIL